jgi:hypothetical protein
MSSDHFVKVFDVLDAGYKDWLFPSFGLIFVAIGIIGVFWPRIMRILDIPYLSAETRLRTLFRFAFLAFAIAWTVGVFGGTYSTQLHHKALLQENRCRIAEGPVEGFVPMPYGGHAFESFYVSGIPFSYSDFVITGGFNKTSSHGGPVNAFSYVRICYDPATDVILRLEIRDFVEPVNGTAGNGGSLWPGDLEKLLGPGIYLLWYGIFLALLLILDLVGIRTMSPSYMRTSLRLKTVAVRNRVLPDDLAAGQKRRLRNSMAYWDADTRRIWLRPREFDFVRVPFMVAALSVAPNSRSIERCEIRLSLVFVLFMALFLWAVHQFISAIGATEADRQFSAAFFGVFALVVLIGSFVNVRIFQARMRELVDDALSEFKGRSELS